MPRYIFLLRANAMSETLAPPSEEIIAAMSAYNTSLHSAGALVSADGFFPTAKDSARVTFTNAGETATVTNGPFEKLEELICGYWIIKTAGFEEAVEWAKKCPLKAEGATIEVRRIADAEHFGESFTKEEREKERKMREELEEKK